MGTSTSGLSSGASPQNWRNPQAEYSVDAIDVTHRLTLSGLYDLPFGAGQRFLTSPRTNRLTSGWQYNVIMTLESGRPIGVTGASNHLATRPNVNPNVPSGTSPGERRVIQNRISCSGSILRRL